MKDDAERAREIGIQVAAECPDGTAPSIVMAAASGAQLGAMLAFAQQPEGWVLVPRALLRAIFSDYMTSQNHHPKHVLIPTDKFEELRAIFDNHTPAAMLDVAPGEE